VTVVRDFTVIDSSCVVSLGSAAVSVAVSDVGRSAQCTVPAGNWKENRI
jgi:hypothetical protein